MLLKYTDIEKRAVYRCNKSDLFEYRMEKLKTGLCCQPLNAKVRQIYYASFFLKVQVNITIIEDAQRRMHVTEEMHARILVMLHSDHVELNT